MSENINPQDGAPQFIPATTQNVPPAPAQFQGQYQPKPSSALAITALVLGIIGFLSGLFFVGGALGIAAIIVAIVALKKTKAGTASGKGMAITGIILGALAIIATIIMVLITIWAFNITQECVEKGTMHADGTITCTVNGQQMTVKR